MALTKLDLDVGNPAMPAVTKRLEFLVDSGVRHSVIPRAVLEGCGLAPLGEQEFRLADGSRIVRQRGWAMFRLGDRVGVADVIFGEQGDSQLLGAFTLAALGLGLDPLRREIIPLPMVL